MESKQSSLDKKTIAIVVLLGLVVVFWVPIMQMFGLKSAERAPLKTADSAQVASDTSAASTAATSTAEPASAGPVRVDSNVTISAVPVLEDSLAISAPVAETVFVETARYTFALSTRGGGPVSIQLKNYALPWDKSTPVELLPKTARVEPQVVFADGKLNTSDVQFTCPDAGRHLDALTAPLSVTFTHTNGVGATLEKTYRFDPALYSFTLIIRAPNRAGLGVERKYDLRWDNPLGATEWNETEDYSKSIGMALLPEERTLFGEDGMFFGDDWTGEQFTKTIPSDIFWVGKRSKYFTVIIAPIDTLGEEAFGAGRKFQAKSSRGETIPQREISIGMRMPVNSTPDLIDSFIVYAGPLDWKGMTDYDRDFETMFDIGTTPFVGWLIRLFAIPIIWLIPLLYIVAPNYGVVIILLGIFVKLITWPLSRKSMKSMVAMRDLAPRMEKLKVRYKDDPSGLQAAMMKMYKEAGVNPMAGCLPILPQMPLFFALFAVFNSTILFRGAPFMLWWDDLSRGAQGIFDPYIILVVIMSALTFVQQKMSITDPKQKMMVYIMPPLFGVMFYSFSSGLVLYWTTFSGWSILEQWWTRRTASRANLQIKNG